MKNLIIGFFTLVCFLIILFSFGCAHAPTDYYINLRTNDRIIVPSRTDVSRNIVIEFISEEEFKKECLSPDVEIFYIEVIEEEYIDQWNRWGEYNYWR